MPFINHHHHHIYFRLPERPQKPIKLATIKQHKENCKNEKKYKKVINDFKNIKYIYKNMQLGLNINTGTQIISRPSDLAE